MPASWAAMPARWTQAAPRGTLVQSREEGFLIRNLIGSLKSGKRELGTCAGGHVVDLSWDSCPYCDGLAPEPRPMSQQTATLKAPRAEGDKRRLVGWIVALSGDNADEDYRLHAGSNLVGTEARCEVVLSGKGIANRHCVISCEAAEFTITALDGRDRTFVNGERVQTRALIDNDVVRLGDVEFEFKSRALRQRR